MRKIICFAFLVGTTVLVSFVGGNIPYIMFYFALMLPISAFLYSFYVYIRLKISQNMQNETIRLQETPFAVMLANEDLIPFVNISLNFHTESTDLKSMFDQHENKTNSDSLLIAPKTIARFETEICCKHIGTYKFGVKSISITDFLGIFTITYPFRHQTKLTCFPRIIPFEQLSSKLEELDSKSNALFSQQTQEIPGYELREYQPGDPRKYIHWKNSAKIGKLLVRKNPPEEIPQIAVIVDLTLDKNADNTQQSERIDMIIEAAVSLANYCSAKKIPIKVVYIRDKICEHLIDSAYSFCEFYKISATLPFDSTIPLEKVWSEYTRKNPQIGTLILITYGVSETLSQNLEHMRKIGSKIILIDAGELPL